MDSRGQVLVLLLLSVSRAHAGEFVEPRELNTAVDALVDDRTRFPCHYRVEEGERVVQVTWSKEYSDGRKEQVVTAHFTDGQTEFERYSGRVRFENSDPTQNAALLIPTTEVSDEGTFTCHITTFPNGNFERVFTLTVRMLPIPSLEPETLVDGQDFGVVATCRAVGRPLPELSWDTDLSGQTQTHVSKTGTVTSVFSLHPLRSMNGKKLDCLVSQSGREGRRRIQNRLVVQYPPDATIMPSPRHWYVGLEEAELTCEVVGVPRPEKIVWTRKGGVLPDGVSVTEEKLVFGRALRANDSGVYQCEGRNGLGVGKAEFPLSISEISSRVMDGFPENHLLIIVGVSAGAVVLLVILVGLLLVNRHHRRRNSKLKRELSQTREEICSLSRHNSFRRVNSVSTDPRVQEDDVQFIEDSRIQKSQMSLRFLPSRGSQSTLGGRWEHADRVDELGRPVVWSDGEESLRGAEMEGEREQRGRRVKSNPKGSNMSLDSGLPSSLTPMKVQPDDCVGPQEPDRGRRQERESPSEEEWVPVDSEQGEEGHEDDESNSSSQISEALVHHFYLSNGVLRPKPQPNGRLMHMHSQII